MHGIRPDEREKAKSLSYKIMNKKYVVVLFLGLVFTLSCTACSSVPADLPFMIPTDIPVSALTNTPSPTPVYPGDENATPAKSLNYIITANDEILILGLKDKTITKLQLPHRIHNRPVTGIDTVAFMDCLNLTSVIIPNSVLSIGSGALTDCFGLTAIVTPSGSYAAQWAENNGYSEKLVLE